MASKQNEEEVVLLAGTAVILAAVAAFLINRNSRDTSNSTGMTSNSSRKRRRGCEDGQELLQSLSILISEIASALRRLAKSKLDIDELYCQVMKTEGFEEELSASAFDHLVEYESKAKAFLAKND